ncbi:MAG: response regulator [Acidobacteria bacterium]|nr:response regulator [Acidobacteriota bacterium]
MRKGKLLIVDDKKLLRDSLKEFLESNDYQVFDIDSGERAIDFLRHTAVDVVLLDEILPGINGLKTLQLIKKLRPEQTVIGLSGEITVKIIEDYLMNGAYDILAKSAIYEKLLTLLEEARVSKTGDHKPETQHYSKIAEELKSESRWEEAGVYLKEAGIEEMLIGNRQEADKLFQDAIACFTRSGRIVKAKEVEAFLELP